MLIPPSSSITNHLAAGTFFQSTNRSGVSRAAILPAWLASSHLQAETKCYFLLFGGHRCHVLIGCLKIHETAKSCSEWYTTVCFEQNGKQNNQSNPKGSGNHVVLGSDITDNHSQGCCSQHLVLSKNSVPKTPVHSHHISLLKLSSYGLPLTRTTWTEAGDCPVARRLAISDRNHYMGVSWNGGTPKWMVFVRENPIKMDENGNQFPPTRNTCLIMFGDTQHQKPPRIA